MFNMLNYLLDIWAGLKAKCTNQSIFLRSAEATLQLKYTVQDFISKEVNIDKELQGHRLIY